MAFVVIGGRSSGSRYILSLTKLSNSLTKLKIVAITPDLLDSLCGWRAERQMMVGIVMKKTANLQAWPD